MQTPPKHIEVGFGSSNGNDSFSVGVEAACLSMEKITTHPLSAVLVFASVRYNLHELLRGISSIVGNVPVFGTTTAGEICNEPLHESVVVCGLASPYLHVRLGIGKNVSKGWLQAVKEATDTTEIHQFFAGSDSNIWQEMTRQGKFVFSLLFSPGNTRYSDSCAFEIIEELKRLSDGHIQFFGGCAADDWKMESNYILYGTQAYSDSLLVAIFETSLRVGISMDHGFSPSNRRAVATKVSGHEIVEIDGKRAADVYAQLLGIDVEKLKGKHLTLTSGRPSGIRDMLDQYRINVASYFTPDGQVRFTQSIPENTTITIMEAQSDDLIKAGRETLRKAIVRGQISKPIIGLVFSCALRQRILKDDLPKEIGLMRSLLPGLPLVGFYSFGEQGIMDSGVSYHGNENITVLVLGDELTASAEVAFENQGLLRQLRASRRKYQSIVDNIGIGVTLISPKMEILEMNRQMRQWFPKIDLGCSPICYCVFNDPPRSQVCDYCPTALTLQDGQVHENITTTPQGDSIINYRIIASPIVNDSGEVIAAIEMVEDVTDQLKLEAHFKQAQKLEAIGTLAGGIAHDFNNLLMGIQGRTSLIASDLEQSHSCFEHITAIEEYVRSASDLTRQLLGIGQGGKYEVKPVDINEVVLNSSAMFGRTRKQIQIHMSLNNATTVVEADKGQIEQMLLNMYINAWQAMPNGGELFLVTKIVTLDEQYCKSHMVAPGLYVKISVTDTGIGMDEATRDRIFDPFFSTKEKIRGTGLGLASAYGIVKNHGGMITVYSEIGHGTTFNVYLPLSEKEVHLELPVESGVQRGSEKILLVDDEEIVIQVGQAMLEKLGYRVIVAKGGQQAVEVVKSLGSQIDLVILDLIMPRMDGSKTFDSIQKIQPRMPVILSSGYSINGQARDILLRGCKGFIQKPFSITELSKTIRKVLDETMESGKTKGLKHHS